MSFHHSRPIKPKNSESNALSKKEVTEAGFIDPEGTPAQLNKGGEKGEFDERSACKSLEEISGIVSEFSKEFPHLTHKIEPTSDGEDPLVGNVRSMLSSMARTEHKLIELNQQALAASVAKEQFLANLSHEIRTPMNGIFGMVNFLLETQLDPVQKDYLETLQGSSELLLNLLNDVLDASRMNSNLLKLRPRNFNFSRLIHEINQAYKPLAAESGNEYKVVIPEEFPEFLVGDDLRLKQILSNLISNAIKFTTNGKIMIAVEMLEDRAEFVELEFVVKDTGEGIPHQSFPTLFDPFTRVENSTTQDTGGTGLGLAICRNLIILMKGEIKVDSELGKGSEFRFNCRLDHGDAPGALSSPILSPPTTTKNSDERPLKVLVVDDKAVNQKVAKISLQKMGCEVLTASDGVEAVAAASGDVVFDAICMDVCMPNMDGIEATRKIRDLDSPNASTRILGITGLASREDRVRCSDAGMDEVITKPIDFRQLKTFVEASADRNSPVADDVALPS